MCDVEMLDNFGLFLLFDQLDVGLMLSPQAVQGHSLQSLSKTGCIFSVSMLHLIIKNDHILRCLYQKITVLHTDIKI